MVKACIQTGRSTVQGDLIFAVHTPPVRSDTAAAVIDDGNRSHTGRLIPSIRKNQSSAAAKTPSAKSDISGGNNV